MNFLLGSRVIILLLILGSCSSSSKYVHKSLYFKKTYKVEIIEFSKRSLYLSSENGTVFNSGDVEELNDSVLIFKRVGKKDLYNSDSVLVDRKDAIIKDTFLVRGKNIYSISNYNKLSGEYKMW